MSRTRLRLLPSAGAPATNGTLPRLRRSSLLVVREKPPHLSHEPGGLLAQLVRVRRVKNDELLVSATPAILEGAVVDAAPG